MQVACRCFLTGVWALLWCALAQSAELPRIAPGKAGFSSERLQRLDALMQRAVADKQYGGVVVLLARHGKVVHFESFGKPNLAGSGAADKDAIFRLASMSKPITGAAMMLLYEEGKWSPEDKLSRFIPEFEHLQVHKRTGSAEREEPEHAPTVRELMTHTAGFGYGIGGWPEIQVYRDVQGHGLFESESLQVMIERLAKAPLFYQPGTRWVYSLSMDIQGHLIEKLSGMTLPQFMKLKLFDPLGMTDTGFYVPPEKSSRFATLYRVTENDVVAPDPDESTLGLRYDREPSLPLGGAGLVSTAADYFRFAQMLLNGGQGNGVRVLSPASVRLMTSNHLPEQLTANVRRCGNCPGFGMGYGYDGAVVIDPARADVPMGKGSYLWDGGLGTWFWIDPVNDLVFVGMVQRRQSADYQPSAAFLNLQALSRALTYQALLQPEL